MQETPTVPSPNTRKPERLGAQCPLDQFGQPINPSDALPISASLLVPTMLTQRELNYLHYLASEVKGTARIIEVGCFLGGSTRPLLVGYRNHHPCPSKLIVYDRFIAPNQKEFEADPSLANYGLVPDQDFLPMYRSLHADYLDFLTIRKGSIPNEYTPEAAQRLYPDQDPIALLFVDAAKAWGVHHTVACTFYPHLERDSVLVHQDIGDFRTPWILIHMYQLREHFEPLDRIHDAPTISFRCTNPPTVSDLNRLLAKHPNDFDPTTESGDWQSLIEYWSIVLQEDATGLFSGYRTTHALHAADPRSAIHHAETYDRWLSTANSCEHYTSPDWHQLTDRLPKYLGDMDASEHIIDRAHTLWDVHRAYARMTTPESVSEEWITDAMKAHRWEQIEERLIKKGIQSVILFGGGRHTRWLIDSGWPKSSLHIQCIVDENPIVDQIENIPLITPDALDLDKQANCIVLPSSDAYESHLIERAHTITQLQGFPIWKVYTDTDLSSATHDEISHACPKTLHQPSTLRPLNPIAIDPSPAHRISLGLDPKRTWADTLATCLGWPDWAQGHINERDSAFIWDLIESIAQTTHTPLHIIELGTASGVSTAMISHGLKSLAPRGSTIDAFDIMEHCYFDPSRKVGEAIYELAPTNLDQISIHHHTNARDAARSFGTAQVELAFIDADHRHPAAALDLLALLPVLAPSAWVILHDIELDLIQSNASDDPGSQSGPHRLYASWPFPKVRENCQDLRESNIGAIQLPTNPMSTQKILLNLINT